MSNELFELEDVEEALNEGKEFFMVSGEDGEVQGMAYSAGETTGYAHHDGAPGYEREVNGNTAFYAEKEQERTTPQGTENTFAVTRLVDEENGVHTETREVLYLGETPVTEAEEVAEELQERYDRDLGIDQMESEYDIETGGEIKELSEEEEDEGIDVIR